MIKELTSEGARFFCKSCESYTLYDEFDMEPYCPECGEKLQVCSKCSQGFFCNKCNGLVSRKKIVWKNK
jgi:predicted RNA-binding Zn-ribbon protein involved in translation (DUF1610 family)